MTASIITNNYLEAEFKKAEDANIIKNVADALQKEFVSSYHAQKKEENATKEDYDKILSMTTMSIKMYANSYYKNNEYLDASDIEQIKKSLSNYAKNQEKIGEFKKAIIEDLTKFQNQIKAKHVQKIVDLTKEKHLLEKEMQVADLAKNKLIMSRLAKIEWPYDAKTKEYDNKIVTLQIKIKKCEQSIANLQSLRPLANEKDILLYQMHLKEQYAQK